MNVHENVRTRKNRNLGNLRHFSVFFVLPRKLAEGKVRVRLGSESKQFRKLLADKANAIGTVAAYPSAYPI